MLFNTVSKRPVTVTILAYLYIAVGAIGFAYHFPQLPAFHGDTLWIEATELLAIVSGTFMLLGRNKARWLALAWIAFHVVISFPAWRQVAVHLVFLALFAWMLCSAGATRYFLGREE